MLREPRFIASRSAPVNCGPLGGDVITFEALTTEIHAQSLVRISGDAEAWDAALDARDSDRLFEEAWSEAHATLKAAASEETCSEHALSLVKHFYRSATVRVSTRSLHT